MRGKDTGNQLSIKEQNTDWLYWLQVEDKGGIPAILYLFYPDGMFTAQGNNGTMVGIFIIFIETCISKIDHRFAVDINFYQVIGSYSDQVFPFFQFYSTGGYCGK